MKLKSLLCVNNIQQLNKWHIKILLSALYLEIPPSFTAFHEDTIVTVSNMTEMIWSLQSNLLFIISLPATLTSPFSIFIVTKQIFVSENHTHASITVSSSQKSVCIKQSSPESSRIRASLLLLLISFFCFIFLSFDADGKIYLVFRMSVRIDAGDTAIEHLHPSHL